MKMLFEGKIPRRGGVFIDAYNQTTNDDIAYTITTRVCTSNHYYVVMEEVKIIKEGNYSPSGHNASSIVNVEGISPTVMENHGTITAVKEPLRISEATKQGYAEAEEGDSVNLAVPNSKSRRGRVGKQMANTLDTGCQQGVVVNPLNSDGDCFRTIKAQYQQTSMETRYRIRKLTPRECFRLMGVDDADIDKIQASGISNAQQYKCAGNSIVVDTLYYIFKQAFCEKPKPRYIEQTLF